MGNKSIHDIYKQNQILTASPKKLIELLFDGAIRFLRLAELANQESNYPIVHENMIKSQEIILELKYSVDTKIVGELPNNLISIYDYLYDQLVQANLTKDQEQMNYVRKHLEELRATWIAIS